MLFSCVCYFRCSARDGPRRCWRILWEVLMSPTVSWASQTDTSAYSEGTPSFLNHQTVLKGPSAWVSSSPCSEVKGKDISSTAHLRELAFADTGISRKISSSSLLRSFSCLGLVNTKSSSGLQPWQWPRRLLLGLEDEIVLLPSF